MMKKPKPPNPQPLPPAPYPGHEATPDTLRSLLGIGATSPVRPGDTIWLNQGTYAGLFDTSLSGQPDAPILVRPKPGHLVTFDGNLKLRGAYTEWWGFEVTNSNPDRSLRGTGIETWGEGLKLINLHIHDCGQGIGSWNTWGEVYGCIINNNGYTGTDRNHGHGLYIQNNTTTWKLVEHNILTEGWEFGVHAYGQSGKTDYLDFRGNVVYRNQSRDFHLGGTSLPVNQVRLYDNIGYTSSANRSVFLLGYNAKNNVGLDCKRNTVYNGRFQIQRWVSDIHIAQNTAYSLLDVIYWTPNDMTAAPLYPPADIDNNTYYTKRTGNPPKPFASDGSGWFSLAEWRQRTGYDANSSSSGWPILTAPLVTVHPNRYEPGRAHIAVFASGAGATSVAVNLDSVLTTGQAYKIYRVPNLNATIAEGVFTAGQAVMVPLDSLKEFDTYLVRSY